MAKAASTSIPAMIERHAELYREMNRLVAADGDDACDKQEYGKLSDEGIRLNGLILATRAKGESDVAAKWHFILRHPDLYLGQDEGCLGWLIEAIIRLDADAVGAALPWDDGCGPASQYWPARIAAAA